VTFFAEHGVPVLCDDIALTIRKSWGKECDPAVTGAIVDGLLKRESMEEMRDFLVAHRVLQPGSGGAVVVPFERLERSASFEQIAFSLVNGSLKQLAVFRKYCWFPVLVRFVEERRNKFAVARPRSVKDSLVPYVAKALRTFHYRAFPDFGGVGSEPLDVWRFLSVNERHDTALAVSTGPSKRSLTSVRSFDGAEELWKWAVEFVRRRCKKECTLQEEAKVRFLARRIYEDRLVVPLHVPPHKGTDRARQAHLLFAIKHVLDFPGTTFNDNVRRQYCERWGFKEEDMIGFWEQKFRVGRDNALRTLFVLLTDGQYQLYPANPWPVPLV